MEEYLATCECGLAELRTSGQKHSNRLGLEELPQVTEAGDGSDRVSQHDDTDYRTRVDAILTVFKWDTSKSLFVARR